jgi:Putative adhesin
MQTPVKVLGLLFIVLAVATSSALAYTQEEVFQRTLPAAGVSMLSVSNVNGAISVQPWDKPEIHIEAKKRVRHSSQETAEQYARQIEIAVETKGDVLEVRTVMPAQKEGWDWVEWLFSLDWLFEGRAREASVSYEISTPPRMDAKLVSTNGRVEIGAIEGRADLHTTNGAVTAEGTQGAVKAHTTNGAISLLQVAGGCNAVTTNGKITAELLSLGSQGCELHTTNGAIHITLPENIRADLDASTTNGNVTSALPLSVQGKISQRGMEGKINGGGAPLKLRTTNGGITIEKAPAREEAMPPASVSSLPSESATTGGQTGVLRIQIWQEGEQKVQISVPLAVAQGALHQLPDSARDHMKEKGVDVEQLLKAVLKHPKLGKLVEIQDAHSRVEIAIE